MQTFLPFPWFARSVAVLDRLSRGRRRIAALHALGTLTGAVDSGDVEQMPQEVGIRRGGR